MKSKWKKLLLAVTILVLFNIFPSYASEEKIFYWNGIEVKDIDDESIILPENVKYSQGQARGDVISTGLLDIANKGKGKASLTIETLAHVRCDRICNALTLQKWNESTEDWEQILHYDFEALQEDNPDEDLVALINGVDVENLQPGTYRARGIHAVYLGNTYESFASKTNGIQITKN